ncbi:MAG: hypothetical protein Q8L11_03460 [Candidatus Moranbacteria bacterium]|nr:hypothetical protein [Candidatus Moranbacteria bacterium]
MQNSKKIIFSTLAVAMLISGVASEANAKTSKYLSNISGIVVSVSNDSFSLKTKKTTYTVKVDSNTNLLSKTGKTIKITDIRSNDTVKAIGEIFGKTMSAAKVRYNS